MPKSESDKAKEIAEQLQQTSEQTEQLAGEYISLARTLHDQGHESEEQLAQAEAIAKKATEAARKVRVKAEEATQLEAKPPA
ncbi:MAG: hypothetical protein ACJ788_12085 [Ktedonobacteraceae bacterium]